MPACGGCWAAKAAGNIKPLSTMASGMVLCMARTPADITLLASHVTEAVPASHVPHSLSRSESSTVQRISCFEKYVSYPLDVRNSTAAGSKRPTNSPWM